MTPTGWRWPGWACGRPRTTWSVPTATSATGPPAPSLADSSAGSTGGFLRPGHRPEDRSAPGGGVAGADRPDQAGVDGRLLLGLAGGGQAAEEVRVLGLEPAGEPRIQPPHDLLARGGAFLFGPGPGVALPGLAGG